MILPICIRPTVFVFLLAFLVNIHCLHGDFVFDDSEAVVNNPDVSGSGPWLDILKDDFWGIPLYKNTSHGSFRPITTAIFRVLWKTVRHAGYFRLLNLLIHSIVSVYLYKVLRIALDLPYDLLRAYRTQVALIASSLFAIHPIHVESICSAVGLADVLSALFFLCGFRVYLVWTRNHQSRILPTKLVAFSALAMFSKEPGVTLLGACGAYELLIICDIIPHHAATKYKGFVNSFKRSSFTRFGFCAATGSVLSLIRCLFVNFRAPIFTPMDNPASFLASPILRAINYQYVYSINLLLLVYPHWLCFDWSMGCIPVITSALDVRFLTVVVFWIILATMVRACSVGIPPRRCFCLSVTLLITPFLPSSNLFLRVGFVIAERNLYLPSIGFCLLVSVALVEIHRRYPNKRQISKFMVVLLFLFLAGRSLRRSRDWVQNTSLFNSGLSVCPLNAKVHYNIAKVSMNHTAAIESYRRALQLNPQYDQAMNNLANIYKELGSLIEAKALLERAVQIRPSFAAAWMNLGNVETGLRNYNKAELAYREALHFRTKYPHCNFNLGNLYLEQQHYERALSAYQTAVAQAPEHLLSWNNMAILLDSLGRLEEAETVAREGLKHLPDAASLHFHLGNTLGKMEKYEESEKHFLKAIQFKQDPTYHSNLGVLYHRWNRLEQAREQYARALELHPSLKSVRENLQKLDQGQHREG